MSEQARGLAIATLAEAYRLKELTPAQIRIYEKALQAVPVALLEPMVARTIATRHGYGGLPQVHELLEDAEFVRVELQKAHPYEGCCECEDNKGWRIVMKPQPNEIANAVYLQYERCPCWGRHREKLARLGVGHTPLALPAANSGRAYLSEREDL